MDQNSITSDDILGKEAVDADGEIIGIVVKLHISKEHKNLQGITIDQGFMKPDLFIGMHYVKNFGIDAIFLNRVPPNRFKGLYVYNHLGKVLGHVKTVVEENHKVTEFVVEKKSGMWKKETFNVPMKHIQQIGTNIILKKV